MDIKIDFKTIVGAVVILAVLAFLVPRLFVSESDLIEKRMEKICELASLSGQESSVKAGVRANEIGKFFTSDISIRAESAPISISSRQELRRLIFRARTQLRKIDVEPRKMEVTMEDDGSTAAMLASIRIAARGPQGSETFREAFEIKWTKSDGKWKIEDIGRHETIRLIE